jgi:hypothetical protein
MGVLGSFCSIFRFYVPNGSQQHVIIIKLIDFIRHTHILFLDVLMNKMKIIKLEPFA